MSAAPLLAHVADGSTQCAIRTSTALAKLLYVYAHGPLQMAYTRQNWM